MQYRNASRDLDEVGVSQSPRDTVNFGYGKRWGIVTADGNDKSESRQFSFPYAYIRNSFFVQRGSTCYRIRNAPLNNRCFEEFSFAKFIWIFISNTINAKDSHPTRVTKLLLWLALSLDFHVYRIRNVTRSLCNDLSFATEKEKAAI